MVQINISDTTPVDLVLGLTSTTKPLLMLLNIFIVVLGVRSRGVWPRQSP